jgi:hypothetical protein
VRIDNLEARIAGYQRSDISDQDARMRRLKSQKLKVEGKSEEGR